jgi:hypothetical protein
LFYVRLTLLHRRSHQGVTNSQWLTPMPLSCDPFLNFQSTCVALGHQHGHITQFKTPSGLSYLGWAHHHFSRGNDDPERAFAVLCSIDSLASPLPSKRHSSQWLSHRYPILTLFSIFKVRVLWDTNMGTLTQFKTFRAIIPGMGTPSLFTGQ